MADNEMYCAICQAETVFQAPPGLGGHDDDCPELLCDGCGTAIVMAPIVVWSWSRPRGTRIAPQQRRAA
ncbi:MAG TPA: hypothetical protein VES42_15560 [Pilimelia sp.]|nr:hypothetical protein [Pilimelia sp.]